MGLINYDAMAQQNALLLYLHCFGTISKLKEIYKGRKRERESE